MSSKFLDKTGLDTLCAKIKSTFQTLGNLVTDWGSTPSDTKYPSEKLVKTSLDAKGPNVPSEVTIATGDKLLIADSSDGNKVKRSSVTFDTDVPKTYLCRNGAFNAVKEADVTWGGSFRAELSPAEFGNMAKNLIHNPITTAITFDKSTDGGATWVSQTISGALKKALCNLAGGGAGVNFGIPNSSYRGVSDPSLLQGRITIYAISGPNVKAAEDTWFYGIVKRILMKVSRNGSAKMKVEYQTWPHFIADDGVWGDVGTFDIQGDSGWNSIPFDNTIGGYAVQLTSGRIIAIRFTFWIASGSTPRVAINNLGFLPQIHWNSNAGNIPLLGLPVYINDDGTGVINSAAKLQTSRKLAVSLSNTSTDTSFNGSADVTNIKTTGTLGIGNGGTGATTAIGAEYNILNQVADIDTTINGDRKIALCNQTKSESNGVFRWLKLNNVWTWIKGLLSSESGVNISGNAATATTATTAAGYTSGGAIDTALQGKATPADIASAIQALDVASQGGDGKYIKAISEADGKISATAETMDTTPTANSTKAVTSGGVKTALDGKQDDLGISSSGDSGKFLNQKGQWAAPSGTEQVNADWDATSGKAEILHKPQNLVQDARYVHTDNNYTTTDKNKVASAVQPGDLGTAAAKDVPASGDASGSQVVLGSDSRLTRSVWSGGDTAVCGYKICTTHKIAGISGQASKIYAIVMGSMCLTNKYASQPQGSDSSGVDGALAMGSFMIWCEGNPDGTLTARARLFSSDAAFNNDDIAICKKYVNGAVEWFVAFGPWTSSKAVTTSRAFGMSVSFDYVQNVNIPDTLEAVPSGYGYESYYSLWKHPYLMGMQQGAGSTTQPVYVTANGEVKTCKKLVQAVTSIDTSNMDPNVLYVM